MKNQNGRERRRDTKGERGRGFPFSLPSRVPPLGDGSRSSVDVESVGSTADWWTRRSEKGKTSGLVSSASHVAVGSLNGLGEVNSGSAVALGNQAAISSSFFRMEEKAFRQTNLSSVLDSTLVGALGGTEVGAHSGRHSVASVKSRPSTSARQDWSEVQPLARVIVVSAAAVVVKI
ncbi:hypothetical protein BDY24DRAFT_402111 [Mrakia frigida]|uniref:uncharacterized protein n=1 Tax=Mrakia frigida TaxID=29902 RepID=UPI003FCC200E